MPDPLLELRDVRAGYAEAVVLDGISLALPAGGSLAVLGRNGVGKTTLLLAIMGFVTLARGSIWLNGADISRLPPHKRAHLEVLDDRHAREDAPAFGRLAETETHQRVRRPPRDVLTVEADAA